MFSLLKRGPPILRGSLRFSLDLIGNIAESTPLHNILILSNHNYITLIKSITH